MEIFPSIELTSNYVKDGVESKSSAIMPAIKIESQNGLLFSADGIFPFEKTVFPTRNANISGIPATVLDYVYQLNLGAGYKYVLNPVFSFSAGMQHEYFYHLNDQNEWILQASIDFQFILAASLRGAYSLNHNYAVIELPVSYRFGLGKNLEAEIKTQPVYWIGKEKSEFKSWTQTLIFSYPLSESLSVGLSLNYARSFLREDSIFYTSLFLSMEL